MAQLEFKKKAGKATASDVRVHLVDGSKVDADGLDQDQVKYVKGRLKKGPVVELRQMDSLSFVVSKPEGDGALEATRILAHDIRKRVTADGKKSITISGSDEAFLLALAEGVALSNYQFLKYYSDADKRKNSLEVVRIASDTTSAARVKQLNNVIRATYFARDLVNEPVSFLTAPQLGKQVKRAAKEFGFKAEVWGKQKIESLKMGGLLAVNKGSLDPPSFSIMEWKPAKPANKKPFVLVGKGVVYDTGGLSLKPTPNSMDLMKSDMGGAAAVIGAMSAIAANKLPIHVVALVPSTDNRPGGNAYAPGDVIKMFDGSTVEVLNTDAEGRMILADALAYAKKYKPELVVELSTLTGAAMRAIGKFGIVGMGNAGADQMSQLQEAGEQVCERVVEFPFWEEYAEELKSTIADVKNLGGPTAGAVTAGKFLERFTAYPYIHLDIAGPSFMTKEFNYRGTGGTAVGVRLLHEFIRSKATK